MIKTVILFGILSAFANCNCEKQINSQTNNKLIKVIIHDFDKSLPYCGYLSTKSIYRAEIRDNNRIQYGDEILIYAICKADNFKKSVSNSEEVYIEVSPDKNDDKNVTIFNFSGYSNDELKVKKEYQLLSIKNN
nr:hypothetical protein [uncultured Chryseobacterium sp.]